MTDDVVPLRRPHFELRDGRLFFLLSRRPYAELDPNDARLLGLVDGVATVRQLRASVPDAGERVTRLRSLGVLEVARAHFPSGRRRVLVVEPHMDDAVLSVGGLMWMSRETCEFTLVTLAGRSNFTSYYYQSDHDYFDVATVSRLRAAESRLAMRLLGGRHRALDLPEAPLRCRPGNWTRAWYQRHHKQVDATIMHAPLESEVESWASVIEPLLAGADADEVWLPMGVGAHTDHELSRNAWLSALGRPNGVEPRMSVKLYQDVPYSVEFPSHTEAILTALRDAGGTLEPRGYDISDALEDKLRLVSIYGSQFKLNRVARGVEEAAKRASPDGAGRYELCYELKTPPRSPDPFAMYSGHGRIRQLLPTLAAWHREHAGAARIRVVSIEPIPHWEVLGLLLDAFRAAAIDLHVPAVYAADGPPKLSSRIELHPVEGGRPGWLARLARLALARPTPTIFMPGHGWERLVPLALAALYPSRPLHCVRMNDLAMALRIVTSPAAR
jgi:LmbE family N-acetylglucosaminyl deacetylase